jgi:hypothetical protein
MREPARHEQPPWLLLRLTGWKWLKSQELSLRADSQIWFSA